MLILKYPNIFKKVYDAGEEKEDFNNELQVLFDEGKSYVKQIAELVNLNLNAKNKKKE